MSEVAKTILQQMGGVNKIKAMTGACNFGASDNLVSFKFKMCKKANYVRITLNSMDLYDVEFIKIWGTKITIVKTYNGIYDDQLKSIFEDYTGLYLSL